MLHQNYWQDSAARKEQARQWLSYIEQNYQPYVDNSIEYTKIYKEDHIFNNKEQGTIPDIRMIVSDTVSVVLDIWNKYSPKKPCVLNFASYTNPGGKFLEGSKAQEECLCHESTLYPVQSAFMTSYYMENAHNKNNAMYLNRALYSPNIIFIRDGLRPVACDVLTCAAPNYTTASKYGRITKTDNTQILKSRCRYLLNVMEENGVDTPILGAYGCGVFGQDAAEVATIFKMLLRSGRYHFKTVIFAVIEGPNAAEFQRILNT